MHTFSHMLTCTQTDVNMYIHIHRQKDRRCLALTDTQSYRLTDRKTGGKAGRQVDVCFGMNESWPFDRMTRNRQAQWLTWRETKIWKNAAM